MSDTGNDWVRRIWAVECAEHGAQLLTDGMAVPDVVQWIRDHGAEYERGGRECEFTSHLSDEMDLAPIPPTRRGRDDVG